MEMAFSQSIFLTFCILSLQLASKSTAQSFICNSNATCTSLIDYVLPNTTTIAAVKTLFGVKNHRSILGANNLPPSTSQTFTLPAKQTIKIPFPCRCFNGTGISNGRPVYKVVPNDGLYHIAAEVFSALVTYEQIQVVNNIKDANLIEVGQELWIPLPCSCDDVDGNRVVHYGHVVASGNTVEGIAQLYNTTEDTLLRLNRLPTPNDLKAGAVLDVPLKACTSMVNNDSPDFPLLVANGTYVYTATNCITCRCDTANNWTLQCAPSQLNSSKWQSCPSMLCEGGDNLLIGNSTMSSNCNRRTCAYAGYNNQTILTSIALESTCPVSDNSVTRLGLQGWKRNFLLTAIHLLLLCLILF
ncbi:hypothetical protein LguiB_022451 [Lonicera macranthoides]